MSSNRSSRDTPIYNLKAVVQETGLKPDTLRAWERRYGVPAPKRTASGHRLYSQNDIDMLHWLSARQNEGLSISRAVDMWQHRQESDSTATASGQPEIDHRQALRPNMHSPATHEGTVLSQMRATWVEACMNFDEQVADHTLAQAFALFPTEMVCISLIQGGLSQIGEEWYHGRVTVQQEHFASALALRRIEHMLALLPPSTRQGRIVIGCPPDENHTFAPLVLTLLLRRRGWDVLYLGANVPVRNLTETLATTHPQLVIMTAQQLHTAANLLEAANALLLNHIPFAYGGRIFGNQPDLRRVIAGHYLGDQMDGVVAEVEQIMASPRVLPAQAMPSFEQREALANFLEKQAEIEAHVWRQAAQHNIPQRQLATANANFSRNIIAALTMGSMEFLGHNLDWIEGLLVYHFGLPPSQLDAYLESYLEAGIAHMDARGWPIVQWLGTVLGIEVERPQTKVRKRLAGSPFF